MNWLIGELAFGELAISVNWLSTDCECLGKVNVSQNTIY